MNQEDHFAQAHFPEPWYLLGMRLRPLSMGHLILLKRAGSPFISEEATEVSVGDLALAVMICRRTFAQGAAMWDDEGMEKHMTRWARTLTRQANWWEWLWNLHKPINLEKKCEIFAAYLKDGTSVPGFAIPKTDSKAIENAPIWQVVKVVLLSKTTLTEEQILDRPYNLCLCDFLTIRAAEGRIDFVDHEKARADQETANEILRKLQARHAQSTD